MKFRIQAFNNVISTICQINTKKRENINEFSLCSYFVVCSIFRNTRSVAFQAELLQHLSKHMRNRYLNVQIMFTKHFIRLFFLLYSLFCLKASYAFDQCMWFLFVQFIIKRNWFCMENSHRYVGLIVIYSTKKLSFLFK